MLIVAVSNPMITFMAPVGSKPNEQAGGLGANSRNYSIRQAAWLVERKKKAEHCSASCMITILHPLVSLKSYFAGLAKGVNRK